MKHLTIREDQKMKSHFIKAKLIQSSITWKNLMEIEINKKIEA